MRPLSSDLPSRFARVERGAARELGGRFRAPSSGRCLLGFRRNHSVPCTGEEVILRNPERCPYVTDTSQVQLGLCMNWITSFLACA